MDLLATICKEAGYDDTAALNLQYTRGAGGLGRDVWKRLASSHVVGISTITRTAPPAYELARRIRRLNPATLIFFGGPHTTALPEEGLRYGDVVVMREGDHIVLDLLRRVVENREDPHWDDIKGIAFRTGGEVVVTPPRPFLTSEELNALPIPRFSPETLRRISNQVMITSRGCPHGCSYCAVIENFGRSYRCLTPERMLEYYRDLTASSRKGIFIGDDNFTANPSRVKAWCELLLSSGLKLRSWAAQVRVEAARDKELLRLMKRAGCDTVMIGLESINDRTLELWNKHSSLEKNIKAVEGFHAAKISVHGMFVLGSEEDTHDTVHETVEFAKRLNLASAQFFSLTPLPGTPLTKEYDEKGCILSKQWQLYDGQHVLVEPGRMNAAELQRGVMQAHREFYSWREGIRHLFMPGSQHRFFNFMIRFAGKRLTRQVCRAAKPHLDSLDNLDQWKKNFQAQFEELRKSLAGLAESLSEDVAERKEKLRQYIEQSVERLRENLNVLKEEYHPYCSQLLESLRTRLLRETEALFPGSSLSPHSIQ